MLVSFDLSGWLFPPPPSVVGYSLPPPPPPPQWLVIPPPPLQWLVIPPSVVGYSPLPPPPPPLSGWLFPLPPPPPSVVGYSLPPLLELGKTLEQYTFKHSMLFIAWSCSYDEVFSSYNGRSVWRLNQLSSTACCQGSTMRCCIPFVYGI